VTTVVYVVELVCLSCGRWIRDVTVSDEATVIRVPSDARCRECGGAPIRSGEVKRQSTRIETYSFDEYRSHVGRPTRAMLAARAALALDRANPEPVTFSINELEG
jgi:hypothetical protein